MVFFLSLFFVIALLGLFHLLHAATVVEDLANLVPPKDFNATITANCLHNPALRFCNSSADLTEIFRFTIVASHLCNESKNPNCVESFSKIDLHAHPNAAALYLSFSFFWKYCPLTIREIDLSRNSLKGPFPTEVLSCSQIQSLDMSDNQLSGDFPVGNFSLLTNLTYLNLSHNQFSEIPIPQMELLLRRFKRSSFVDSGLQPNRQRYTIKFAILFVALPTVVLLATCIIGWLCCRRPDYLPGFMRRDYMFTPAMLRAATNGFAEDNLVVQNGGVSMYRGQLRNGTYTRIEVYKDDIPYEERRTFAEECKILVQLRHRSLVRVLGWCNSRRLRALVTEWIDGQDVETWLKSSAPSWRRRLKLVVRVVEGMCYLRNHWPEVTFELKTGSLLLSGNQDPLISRFKVKFEDPSTHVYKFGLFLLEIVTNLRPNEDVEGAEYGFAEYIRVHFPKNLNRVIDERMTMTESTFHQAKQCIGLGLVCTELTASKQPGLDHIYYTLVSVYESCLNHRQHGEITEH